MASKIRVYGKAQNRTALGIINAYQVMFPHATYEDFKKSFPDEINPDCGTKRVFMTEKEIKQKVAEGDSWYAQGQGYFAEPEEYLTSSDGIKFAVVRMWTKPSFERLVSHAKSYDIEVAEFTAAEKGIGKKGGWRLEYLNGYVPPKPEKSKTWLWILIGALVVIALLAILLMRSCTKEPQVVEKIITVVDTVYVQQIEEFEKNFNAAQFEKGKTDLSDASKFVLHDLAKLMEKQESIKLKIVGHTSAEGDANFNQKLSENRAKAAVDFLILQGISENRLQWEGKGSSELKDASNPESNVNRRTEFIVIE